MNQKKADIDYKYYDYSVRKILLGRYGEDTVFSMRNSLKNKDCRKRDNQYDKCALWRFADSRALAHFVDGRFLTETSIEDDYIAYKYRFGNSKAVFLMFMLTEESRYFDVDVSYINRLIKQWGAKGYKAYILRVCIDFEKRDDMPGCRFVTYSKEGSGEAIYELKKINQSYLLVPDVNPCWEIYNSKLLSVTASDDIKEYKCLFDDNIEITSGENRNKIVHHKGVKEVMNFFRSVSPVKLIYRRSNITGAFYQYVVADKYELTVSVSRCNLVSGISISDFEPGEYDIVDKSISPYGSLVDSAPKAISIRLLNKEKMHGYVLQITYSDDNVRNYYLHSFNTPAIEERYEVDGYIFDDEVFASANLKDNGDVVFVNGYFIPKHILCYHSYRLVQVVKTGGVLCKANYGRIRSIYKLPLKEFKSHFSIRQYWGTEEECFGPMEAYLDKDGNRISDIMLYSIDSRRNFTDDSIRVEMAPSGKEGYIRDDGSWLIPPVYDVFKGFSDECILASRMVNGESKSFIINKKGEERPFNNKINNDLESYGTRIPFYSELWKPDAVQYTSVRYDSFADYWLKPGKWGFLDEWGDVVIEPQYVFVEGFDFYLVNEEASIAAKMVDNKLKWGLIDRQGGELIPFIYEELYTPDSNQFLAFRKEGEELFGLIDCKGNVICDPKFGYIDGIDEEHGLITAGADEDNLGVYSLEAGEMVIPVEFDYVCYQDNIIECEESYSSKCKYYNYQFEELSFEGYTIVHEQGGIINAWKNGKSCVMDLEGNELVPPVMENGTDYSRNLYERGYYISGSETLKGLKNISGEIIIPERYASIHVYGDYVKASDNMKGNWNIKDTLYDISGNILLDGAYRNMHFEREKNEFTVETQEGVEYCIVETN